MIGAIIGDIVGSRFEFDNTSDYNFELFTKECDFTDDTICTVAIAFALVNGSSYEESLRYWCSQYPYPKGGYGASFSKWLHSPDPKPYNSFGNGSAMRVSPVAWWFDDLEEVKREAEKTAMPTHDHPEGIKGAVAVAHAIWHFRKCGGLDGFAALANEYYPNFERTKFVRGEFDETCMGTVPLAFQIIMKSTSFEDAIRRAVSWGGDSDTIGAIVGSIAEAVWGIPDEISNKTFNYLSSAMDLAIGEFYKYLNDRELYG